jgi:hypothetical protein
MSSLFDYSPSGYREWFVNSGKFRFGDPNRCEVFTSQQLQDVVAVTVLEAQIPYTFYTINQNNNVLAVVKTPAGSPPSGFTLTIPAGNYSPETLCTALLNTNCNAWPSGAGVGAPLFTAATFSGAVGKLILTVNSVIATGSGWFIYTNEDADGALPKAALSHGLYPPRSLCIEPTGVSDIRAPVDLPVTPGTAVQLPYMIALGGPPYLAIRANFGIGGADNIVVCEESGDQKYGGNVLCMVPVNTIPGGTITWKNIAPRGGFFALNATAIDSATFWVTTGDDDTQMDFNGHGFQFKLGFILRNRGAAGAGSRYTNDRAVTSSSMM